MRAHAAICVPHVFLSGSGKIRLTGSLGNVMQESVHTALSWIRAHNPMVKKVLELTTGLNVTLTASGSSTNGNMFSNTDIHVHFPSGAVPKVQYYWLPPMQA